MRKRLSFTLLGLFCINAATADTLDLTTALQNTYTACYSIDENLHDMKVKAGINTAITAVGTGLGVGATAVGFVKASKDAEIAELEEALQEIIEQTGINEKPEEFLQKFEQYLTNITPEQLESIKNTKNLTQQSKKLGNWRTGLMAGSTATNIAGAAIAGTNKVSEDLETQIKNCISATQNLNSAIMQAKINGEDITEATNIFNACREYEFVDITPINKRATGAMASSIVGAGVGLAGTVTSGIANTDATRNDNSDKGKKKAKDLNTASNVLAVGATAASVTATVFNATQIAAIKKIAAVSESCTGVLK
ncbi:MAG: hypothetical protein IKZ34_01580 [Alphaproteobacteria bacterium]|nr:hypothetical protein [Alphaproteobacteria bacterium]